MTDQITEHTPSPRAHSHPFVPYRPTRLDRAEAIARGRQFYALVDSRRSVRFFAPDPVPREMIEIAVAAANTAPSGAHHQPWKFVAVADADIKHRIREAAEHEERINYEGGRLPEPWREALAPLETTSDKSYLEVVPWVVVVFAEKSTPRADGSLRKNYYVNESVGIACGLFITALHTMGLATLTHTPNPMGFLTEILERPATERPYILFPIGYPAPDCEVPDLRRKPLTEALEYFPPRPPA
ncbi:nitroreductase family protein [Nocardia transvalensis]|uniref:nitroreductase family protein n=1 Tax=Nocardia transvalensis TaxID=37333 RepID=UPI00189499F9|nr:nitroreductase family protein [Nocardia transvalensis]MBF6328369.1 nitroreductase family protein [Nocardia transvalensis]